MSEYERTVQLADESAARARSGPIIIHTRELEMEVVASLRRKRAYISEPQILGSMVQTMAMFIAEIPAGGKSGKHRHFNEALIYILSGRGHSVIEGERHDWEEADVISVPLFSWHQHFNDDPERSVRYLGITNIPLLRAMGLNRIEDERSD
jgi:gentisate 1,2-dioxygenase